MSDDPAWAPEECDLHPGGTFRIGIGGGYFYRCGCVWDPRRISQKSPWFRGVTADERTDDILPATPPCPVCGADLAHATADQKALGWAYDCLRCERTFQAVDGVPVQPSRLAPLADPARTTTCDHLALPLRHKIRGEEPSWYLAILDANDVEIAVTSSVEIGNAIVRAVNEWGGEDPDEARAGA